MPKLLSSVGGYRFRSTELLTQALTHRSSGPGHNERLEFLGDAVLGCIIAEVLYERFTNHDEGLLTRARAMLVNRRVLARIARELGIGKNIHLGEGEIRSGGWSRDSILSGALEALIGAIYLDAGYDACKAAVSPWFASELVDLHVGPEQKDPKTRLQEILQARGMPLPDYSIIETSGDPHTRVFTVRCLVHGLQTPVTGTDTSRKGAEQRAARAALTRLMEGQ